MTHKELVDIAGKWAIGRHQIVICEKASFFENPDVMAFSWSFTTLIECKISRADFLRDKYKPTRRRDHSENDLCMGNYRIYCCPKGLLKEDDIPDSWGLLEVYPSGYAKLATNLYTHQDGAIWWHELTNNGLKGENRMLFKKLVGLNF